MPRSGKVRIAEVMRSESVVRQHKKGETGGAVRRGTEVGPYRSFSNTELVLAFTGLRARLA